jgi:hypothetical protein
MHFEEPTKFFSIERFDVVTENENGDCVEKILA